MGYYERGLFSCVSLSGVSRHSEEKFLLMNCKMVILGQFLFASVRFNYAHTEYAVSDGPMLLQNELKCLC